jgi:hypothetical protein
MTKTSLGLSSLSGISLGQISFGRSAAAMGGALAALLALLTLAACTSSSVGKAGQREDLINAPIAEPGAQVQRFRIRDWSAPNDHTIVIVADDGTRYRAETMGPCLGLDFTNQVAFVNRGGFQQIDRFSSVVLGDGTRCAFQSFDKLRAPESKALDQYEKSREAKPAKDASATAGDAKPK